MINGMWSTELWTGDTLSFIRNLSGDCAASSRPLTHSLTIPVELITQLQRNGKPNIFHTHSTIKRSQLIMSKHTTTFQRGKRVYLLPNLSTSGIQKISDNYSP